MGACDGVSQYSTGNWSAGVERSSTVSSHVRGLRKLNQREERTIEYDHWNCDHSTLIGGYFDMRQECQTSDWTNEGGLMFNSPLSIPARFMVMLPNIPPNPKLV